MNVLVEPLFLLSTVVVLVAIFAPVLLSHSKEFTYAVLYDGLFDIVSEPDGEDKLDEIARERVRVIAIELRNSSGRHIDRSHYARPITVGFGKGARILGAEVVKENPPGIGAALRELPAHAPERVALSPVLLNYGDRLLLEVVVSDAAHEAVEVEGRIFGIREIVDRSRSNLERSLLVVNAGTLFAAAILMGSAGLLAFVSDIFDVDLLGPRVVNIAGGVVVGSAVGAILLLLTIARRWRRASRIARLVRSRHFTAEDGGVGGVSVGDNLLD